MIDTAIRALLANGIKEIYVIVGYLKEQFKVLETDYSEVKLIDNPYYDYCNNIASIYVAREFLEDCIIMDGDFIVYNKDILSPEFEKSGYNCVWTDDKTDEWLLTLNNDGIVEKCQIGSERGWQLFGISRWSAEDGKILKKCLETEFEENKNYQIFWDEVALFCHKDKFRLGIRKMQKGDIVEIDNFGDLLELDSSYKTL